MLVLGCSEVLRLRSCYRRVPGEHIVLLIKGLVTAVCEIGQKQTHFQMANGFIILLPDSLNPRVWRDLTPSLKRNTQSLMVYSFERSETLRDCGPAVPVPSLYLPSGIKKKMQIKINDKNSGVCDSGT